MAYSCTMHSKDYFEKYYQRIEIIQTKVDNRVLTGINVDFKDKTAKFTTAIHSIYQDSYRLAFQQILDYISNHYRMRSYTSHSSPSRFDIYLDKSVISYHIVMERCDNLHKTAIKMVDEDGIEYLSSGVNMRRQISYLAAIKQLQNYLFSFHFQFGLLSLEASLRPYFSITRNNLKGITYDNGRCTISSLKELVTFNIMDKRSISLKKLHSFRDRHLSFMAKLNLFFSNHVRGDECLSILTSLRLTNTFVFTREDNLLTFEEDSFGNKCIYTGEDLEELSNNYKIRKPTRVILGKFEPPTPPKREKFEFSTISWKTPLEIQEYNKWNLESLPPRCMLNPVF